MDDNGDNFVTSDELKSFYSMLGQDDIGDDEVDKMMHKADTNVDGKIDFKEFAIASSLK